jgi:hypothetical protein
METLLFDKWNHVTGTGWPAGISSISAELPEETITIDAQIDVKVRGDLPEAKLLNSAIAFMERKMNTQLEYEYDQFRLPYYSELEGVLDFGTDKKSPAFEEIKKFHLQKLSELAELKAKSHRRNKFLFSIEPGFEVIIPPYDHEWTNSFNSSTGANRMSGSLKSFPSANGYCGSAVGVFLTPTADVSVRFSAHCPISYSWSNFVSEGGGYAASQGGVALTIYNATTRTLIKDEQERLWSQSKRPSVVEVSGGSDDLYFQSTDIGHTHFSMKAGDTYLVWLWCWAFADSGPNAAAYATVDCKVPFMIVDSTSL